MCCEKMFAMMTSASYIWLCDPGVMWCHHLCSIADSASEVIVWLSISLYYPTFILI